MAASPRINRTTIESAITSLLKWRDAKSETEKPQLIPTDDFLYLYITLTKIPSAPRATNPNKIPLAHALYTPSNSDICLIIDDRPNSGLTKRAVKEKVLADGLPVSKVIRVSKLVTDYKAFEAKRKLCGSYDLFLVDRRVVHFLPRALGKEFFRKKKVPVPVELGRKRWGGQVERVCRSGLLYFGKGSCCVLKVGRVGGFGVEELVENVVKGIEGIIERVPKGWKGVRSLSLKLDGSVALPVYTVVPESRLKIDGAVKGCEEFGEVVAQEEAGEKKGKKEKKNKKKGKIHDVRYMDYNEGEVFDEDDQDSDFDDGIIGDVESIDDEEFYANISEDASLDGESADEDEELEKSDLVGKKRKKAGKKNKGVVSDSSELKDEKPAKKKSKVKSVDVVEKKKKKAVKKDTLSEHREESDIKDKKRKIVAGKPKRSEVKLKAKKGKMAK